MIKLCDLFDAPAIKQRFIHCIRYAKPAIKRWDKFALGAHLEDDELMMEALEGVEIVGRTWTLAQVQDLPPHIIVHILNALCYSSPDVDFPDIHWMDSKTKQEMEQDSRELKIKHDTYSSSLADWERKWFSIQGELYGILSLDHVEMTHERFLYLFRRYFEGWR